MGSGYGEKTLIGIIVFMAVLIYAQLLSSADNPIEYVEDYNESITPQINLPFENGSISGLTMSESLSNARNFWSWKFSYDVYFTSILFWLLGLWAIIIIYLLLHPMK